jgi:hypothetical protein
MHIALNLNEEMDFCDPPEGHLLEKVKHSSTTGYFADQIVSSPYFVDLQQARLPMDVAGL